MPDLETPLAHLYRCAMGGELYHSDLRGGDLRGSDLRGGDLRWCYMCMDWVVDGTPCRGEFDVAQSSGSRG